MKRFSLHVVMLAAAVTLTSFAAAAPDAAKQLNLRVGVAITTKGATIDWNTSGRGTFVRQAPAKAQREAWTCRS